MNDSIKDIGFVIRDTLRVNYLLMRQSLSRHDITMEQCHVLLLLKESRHLEMGKLAETLGVTSGAATGIISRLVRRRLISRAYDTKDRRRVIIKLTSRGKGIVQEISKIRRHRLKKVFSEIPKEEIENFRSTLMKVNEHLRRELDNLENKKEGNE